LIPASVLQEVDQLIGYIEAGCADPSLGATHYLNIPLTKQINGGKLPSWVSKMTHLATIGQHDFYKE
jgi:hypothetical protein